MDNKLYIILLGMVIILAMSVNVEATTQFWQEKYLEPENETNVISDHLFYTYLDKDSLDYISGDNPLQVYLWYSIYVKTWNEQNPTYSIEYCNLTVKTYTSVSNTPSIYTEVYTENTDDISNGQYFVQLNEGDVIIADIFCKFDDDMPENLEIPETMQIVTPTWNCRACQYYEWLQRDKSIQKAKLTGNNINTIVSYITDYLQLNYEIVLTLFWIFNILILFSVITLIFVGGFWLYTYLSRLAK